MIPASAELARWLHQRLAAHQPRHDGDHPDYSAHRAAAVLIALVLRPQGATILLTERAQHLSTHAGQISFPGGRVEETDADVVAAALREAQEEIGLDPAQVSVVGRLGSYATISGYLVTPVVACVAAEHLALSVDPGEVAAVFELPASVLLDPARYERRVVERRGIRGVSHFVEYDGKLVWGATAGMLLMLIAALDIDGSPRDLT
ncbi:putative Nudix hydrolase NudL [Andreprevotia sp. IGB-42]|uniref:CoA pyrophosphatase n=1 Tax=Andreprevotia sp. IGB-42 TaxID=2497473 RepID=UPI00135B8213|nr:CoA pyrophosphatase [Andreprevotia sp. IGB-42]KAF0814237.1 putative Nudix hydrolase NudL [Andreprevotia sp. IGB-42]